MRTLADLGDRAAEVSYAPAEAGRRVGATAERGYRETVRPARQSQRISALLPLALLLLAIPLLGWLLRGAPHKAESATETVIRPTPVQPSVAQAPHEPAIRPAPVQPSVVQGANEPAIRPAPVQPSVVQGANEPTIRPASAQPPVVQTPEVRVLEPNRPVTTVSPTLIPTRLNVSELRLPDGVTLQLPESSFLNAIYEYLSNTTATSSREFVFDGLEFDDVGIRVRPEIETAITNLTKLLRAFPSVTLRIEGHTDPSGYPVADRNRSLAWADALKDMLVKAGVPSNRLTTAGLGSEHPVASNDTAEGRVKNRRIELLLSKSL
jgi:outer membrane protein OmpA-like peptidoglycan-associated protein